MVALGNSQHLQSAGARRHAAEPQHEPQHAQPRTTTSRDGSICTARGALETQVRAPQEAGAGGRAATTRFCVGRCHFCVRGMFVCTTTTDQENQISFLAEWLVRLPFNQKVLGSIPGKGKSKMLHNFLTFQCKPWGSNPRACRAWTARVPAHRRTSSLPHRPFLCNGAKNRLCVRPLSKVWCRMPVK